MNFKPEMKGKISGKKKKFGCDLIVKKWMWQELNGLRPILKA
jgi:hypothetical protein